MTAAFEREALKQVLAERSASKPVSAEDMDRRITAIIDRKRGAHGRID